MWICTSLCTFHNWEKYAEELMPWLRESATAGQVIRGPRLAVINLTSSPCLTGVELLGLPFFQMPPPPPRCPFSVCSLCTGDDAMSGRREWGPQRLRGDSLRAQPSLRFVNPLGGEARAAAHPPKPEVSNPAVVYFFWTHTLENYQGQDMIEEPSPSLFKSPRFYDIVFHWRSSLKNEVEIPKEIASISSRA